MWCDLAKGRCFIERTPDMVFALERKVTKKGKNSVRTNQIPIVRRKGDQLGKLDFMCQRTCYAVNQIWNGSKMAWHNTFSFTGQGKIPQAGTTLFHTYLNPLSLYAQIYGSFIVSDTEFSYSNLYQAYKSYCNGVSGTLNLCGLSLGAILAMNFAIENPERVHSLVLIGAQYKMPKGLLKFQNFIFRFMPNSAFDKMGIPKSDVIKLTDSMVELDFSMALKNILCGTLVMCGASDNANKKAARFIAEAAPNAEHCLIEGAGHEVNIDAPVRLAAVLSEYWSIEQLLILWCILFEPGQSDNAEPAYFNSAGSASSSGSSMS